MLATVDRGLPVDTLTPNSDEQLNDKLIEAITKKDTSIFKQLVPQLGDPNTSIPFEFDAKTLSSPLLHIACYLGFSEGVEYLCNLGADVNIQLADYDNYSPIHFACMAGELNAVLFLIAKGINVMPKTRSHGDTPLHIAAKKGHLDIVNELTRHPILVNIVDNEHVSPLYRACELGNEDCAVALLRAGAKTQSATQDTTLTPVYVAINKGHFSIALKLLYWIPDENQFEPEIEGKALEQPSIEALLISKLCRCEDMQALKSLVRLRPRSIDSDYEGIYPLMVALLHQQMKVYQYLIDSGAELNIMDTKRASLLHYACAFGTLAQIQFLISKGLRVDAHDTTRKVPMFSLVNNPRVSSVQIEDLEKTVSSLLPKRLFIDLLFDHKAHTPFHLAALQGELNLVKAMLPHIRNIDHRGLLEDNVTASAIEIAAGKAHVDIVEFLISKGANPFLQVSIGTPTALHVFLCCFDKSVSFDDFKKLVELLSNDISINALDSEGCSPLSKALRNQYIQEKHLQFLFERGAQVSYRITQQILEGYVLHSDLDRIKFLLNHRDKHGNSIDGIKLLKIALSVGNHTIVRHLFTLPFIQKQVRSNDCKELIVLACINDDVKVFNTVLQKTGISVNTLIDSQISVFFYALVNGKVKIAAKILETQQANPLAKTRRIHAFHVIAEFDYSELCQQLLNMGISPMVQDEHGGSPLSYAISFEKTDVFELLLQHSPKLAELPDKEKRLPLHQAVEQRRMFHISCLAKTFPEGIFMLDKYNRCPYQIAVDRGDTKIKGLLDEHIPPLPSPSVETII
ncbi:hypothetical protein D5018_00500 [Parashewanella curva]|uniref:Uncharacterized protein n=1 Tax=Parashewanella curva TaxID=2338552 RepID=A0A3L8Q3G1_9GAMM|nr:ankyrin repeat domain-containing protein [Parashewanella curva]RLV61633.1 hypothetical protein D5018_00500 [Parashewanella curva]